MGIASQNYQYLDMNLRKNYKDYDFKSNYFKSILIYIYLFDRDNFDIRSDGILLLNRSGQIDTIFIIYFLLIINFRISITAFSPLRINIQKIREAEDDSRIECPPWRAAYGGAWHSGSGYWGAMRSQISPEFRERRQRSMISSDQSQ